MTVTRETAKRFREVMLDGTWVANTNFKNELDAMVWQTATAQVDSLNTIAVLAQHIAYYMEGILNVFKGGTLDIKDQFSFDFAPIESQAQWRSFLDRFFNSAEDFALEIEKMSAEELRNGFVDEKYGSIQRNIDGMIEHAYYHLGQIVLLKKIIAGRR